MKKSCFCLMTVLIFGIYSFVSVEAAPNCINFQGIVKTNGILFNGTGYFRFALVDALGSQYFWSNDGVFPPAQDIEIAVEGGLYNVELGHSPDMHAIPASVFEIDDIYLRIWFDDSVNGLQQFTPDQRIVSSGYSLQAENANTLEGHSASDFIESGSSLDADTFDGLSREQFLRSDQDDVMNGKLDITGSLDVSGTSFFRNVVQTGGDRIEVNFLGSGNRYSYIDLIGDETYTGYGLRLMRGDDGPNTSSGLYHRGTGLFQLYLAEAGNLALYTDSTERMRITSSGLVGIGNNTPEATLDVAGSTFLRGNIMTGGSGIEINGLGTGNRSSFIDFHGDDTYTSYALRLIRNNSGENANSVLDHRGTGALIFKTSEAGAMRFYTNDTHRAVISSAGNVGIGTTSPAYDLDVAGDIRLTGAFRDSSGNAGIDGQYLRSNGSNVQWVDILSSSDDDWTISGNNIYHSIGKVGIGTSSPVGQLDVVGNTYLRGNVKTEGECLNINELGTGNRNSYIDFYSDDVYSDYSMRIIRNNNGENSNSEIIHRGTGDLSFNLMDAGNLTVYTSEIQRMIVTAEGKVGIGTSDPATELEVIGFASISEDLNVDDIFADDIEVHNVDANVIEAKDVNASDDIEADDDITAGDKVKGNYVEATEQYYCPSADVAEKLPVHPDYALSEDAMIERLSEMDIDDEVMQQIVELNEISKIRPGTVVVISSEGLIPCSRENDTSLAGIISTKPALKMASNDVGQYVALAGRVPCNVIGPVKAGDLLTSSSVEGYAQSTKNPVFGSIVGKALADFDGDKGTIDVWVGGL